MNATGPWLDHSGGSRIRRAAPSIRLSKGVHVVVDGGEDWGAAVTIPQSKVRVSFAIPWEGMLLLGTTDTLHEGEPDDARVTDEDVRTILDEAASAIDGIGAPRASFLGLRVLPGRPRRDRERAPRDGLHPRPDRDAQRRRRQADDLPPDRARRARPARRPRTSTASRARCRARSGSRTSTGRSSSTRATRSHLLHLYGSLARRCRRARRSTTRRCSSRSCPDAPTCARRMRGRATHEFALHDEDVIRRRTTGWLRRFG